MAATTYYLSGISLIVQYLTNVGIIAQGAQLYTYLAGTVNTLQTTYTDSTGTVPNANPMTLSSAGRPVAVGGSAPVAFWVTAGIAVNLQVFDVTGNLLVTLNNVGALNDPSAVLTQLAAATTGSGADLVANAVRSYDIFATARAANVPNPASGQTLIVIFEGGSAIGDGNGGEFYWSGSSLANDDNFSVLRPNAVLTGARGRYLRIPLTPYRVFKTNPTTIASSTSVASDPDLQFPIPGAGTYGFQVYIQDGAGSTSAGGLKGAMAFSGTLTDGTWGSSGGGSGANASTQWYTISVNPTGQPLDTSQNGQEWHLITGSIQCATSGVLAFQWAQNSSNATGSVVAAGSWMNIFPL